jgi:hypothetical protein
MVDRVRKSHEHYFSGELWMEEASTASGDEKVQLQRLAELHYLAALAKATMELVDLMETK